MGEKKLDLQPRLQALADWVRPGARLADVGTDHGYLPVWLRLHGVVEHAIASDLRPAPLDHARRSAAAYGASDIEFRLCDGLKGIASEEADTVVVAGMGGENIAAILEASPWCMDGAHFLLLQPMSRDQQLRAWLPLHGGRVLRERLVEDKGTLYPILEVVGGAMPPATPAQCYGGFALSGDPLWGAYLEERITKLRRAAEGLRRSSGEEEQLRGAELEKLAEELCVRKGEWEHANCGRD